MQSMRTKKSDTRLSHKAKPEDANDTARELVFFVRPTNASVNRFVQWCLAIHLGSEQTAYNIRTGSDTWRAECRKFAVVAAVPLHSIIPSHREFRLL